MVQDILGSLHLDRRQALELVKQVPALAVLVQGYCQSQKHKTQYPLKDAWITVMR